MPVYFVHKNDHRANRDPGMLFRWEVGLLYKFPSGGKAFGVFAKRVAASRGEPYLEGYKEKSRDDKEPA